MNWLKGSPDWLYEFVDWLVTNVEDILIRATPVISPLPSAFATVHALTRANWAYPWLMGFVIEGMGLCAGALIGYIETNNRKFPDRAINVWWGRGLFGFYVMLVVAVIAGYETIPNLLSWVNGELSGGEVIKSCVPLLFPGLTLVGSVIVALRQYMKRNEEEFDAVTESKRERESEEGKQLFALKLKHLEEDHAQKLELARVKALSGVQKTVQLSSGQLDTLDSEVDAMLDIFAKNPKAKYREVGHTLGKSPTTISTWVKKLELSGHVHVNGGGVEVVK